MKNTIAFAFIILAFTVSAQSQTPQVVWSRSYGGPNADEVVKVIATPDHGIYLLANSDFLTPRYWDPVLYRLDSLGDTLWSRSIDRVNVWARDLAAMPDGGCVVLARLWDSLMKDDFLIVRYNSAGDTLWARQFGGTGYQTVGTICVDNQLNVVVAGESMGDVFPSETYVLKVSAAGDSLWVRTLNLGFNGWGSGAAAIRATATDEFLIAGTSAFVDDAGVPFVVLLDADGQVLFVENYWMINAIPNDLALYPDGGFAISGQYRGEYWDFNGPWLLRGKATGDSLWSYVDSTSTEQFRAVAVMPDGGLLTYGSIGALSTRSAVLTRFDQNGRRTMRFEHRHAGEPAEGFSLDVSGFSLDSSVVLAGRVGDSLGTPCSHCDLYLQKMTSLPLGRCGDIDGDGLGPDISDLAHMVDYLFFSLPSIRFPALADLDASGQVDISDLTVLVEHLFLGGPAPVCP